jgi:hypothetical protein
MNVAHQFPQVAIRLAKDGLVPALKQMSDLLVLSIVILTVTSEQPVHHPTHRIVQHLSQQMHVIGHQAVSVKIEGTLRLLGLEKSEKLKIVIFRTEDAPPIIAAGNDVIEPAGYFNSRFPCPRLVKNILPKNTNVNISRLTPSGGIHFLLDYPNPFSSVFRS